MTVIGLTGGIASGKSAVAELLRARGAVIVDADVLAREVVEPGTPGLEAIRARFGEAVIGADGRLDRPRLASIVFADADARADLNAIVHPRVRELAAARGAAALASDPGAVVVEVIPLLVESGRLDPFDLIVVVDAPVELQRSRLMARNGFTAEEADARINAQATRADRLAAADVVITNDRDLAWLEAQVEKYWPRLTGLRSPGRPVCGVRAGGGCGRSGPGSPPGSRGGPPGSA
ncbi:MAG: dephospho-CoA kinase [Propioniciclava sp.]|uniref:dephospho-CoA kinase n=1 Tax=Propioniciclava sp. TaxID=2038686 RepID=UPI0039E5BD52